MRPVTDITRRVAPFHVVSEFQPSGDQPQAIAELEKRVNSGEQDVVLLGATGTGKTATVAWLAERLQRPMLVMQPNKTLAAQFAQELRTFFPDNAVEYFVSYYDYYQPEAYIPQTDTYIEKDSSLNKEVERLRHSATNSLLTRRDVIVVSTVSAIYGLGTPQEYVDRMIPLEVGQEWDRDELLRDLVTNQYVRNDISGERGTFRVRGDTLEIFPVYEENALRVEFFGDEIEALTTMHPLTGEIISEDEQVYVFPATHYVAGPERMERAIASIQQELEERLADLADRLPERLSLHVNGCPNSCARIQTADIGLKGQLLPDDDGGQTPGFQVHLGGGLASVDRAEAGLGRSVRGLKVRADGLVDYVERVVRRYDEQREPGETFARWAHRVDEEALR